MSQIRTAIQEALQEQRERQHRLALQRTQATKLRLAWSKGITTLYKFLSLNPESREFTLDILRNFRVHFASPESFNDPFDCAPPVELGGALDDPAFRQELTEEMHRFMDAKGLTPREQELLRARGNVTIERLAEEVRAHTLHAVRATTRILCLSTTHQHPLMWSHYAARHTGICLHFQCDAGNVFGLAREVLYPPDRTPILIPISRQTAEELTERLVLTKADFWAYEHEYRVVALTDIDWGHTLNEHNCLKFSPHLLCGITLGMNTGNRDRNEILTLAAQRNPPIPVFQALQSRQRFWMDIVPLDI